MTHSYSFLPVPQSTYDAVRAALKAVGHTDAGGYPRQIDERKTDDPNRPALDMHGLALIPAVDVARKTDMPERGEVRQVCTQLFVWRVNQIGSVKIGEWIELARFDKSSESAYVGAIVERAIRVALNNA